MLAAFTIIAGFVFPVILVLAASGLSLAAVQRHITFRQLVFTGLVWLAGVAAVTAMTRHLAEQNSIAVWPLIVIAATLLFSVVQFVAAVILGAVTQLRHMAGQ